MCESTDIDFLRLFIDVLQAVYIEQGERKTDKALRKHNFSSRIDGAKKVQEFSQEIVLNFLSSSYILLFYPLQI